MCVCKKIYNLYIETYIDMDARISGYQHPQHGLDLLYHFVEKKKKVCF